MHLYKNIIKLSVIFIFIFIVVLLTAKIFPILKLVFFAIGKLLLPFLIAAFISYLIYPIVLKLEQYNIHKVLAIVIIYVSFFLFLSIVVYKSVPAIIKQLEQLSEQLPQLLMMYEEMIYSVYESTSFLPDNVREKIDNVILTVEMTVEQKISNILNRVTNVFDFIIVLTLIPVLVFYFLKDYSSLRKTVSRLVPKKYRANVDKILFAVDGSLGSYIRGQVLVSSSIIVLTLIIYEILQLEYAFLLAIFMGLMNVIPYFGPIIGTIPALFISMTMSWQVVTFVIIATLIIQLIESSLLSPYIMGKSVQIHPLLIILLLLIGAQFAGIIGMLVAVPLATIIRGVVFQFLPSKEQSY